MEFHQWKRRQCDSAVYVISDKHERMWACASRPTLTKMKIGICIGIAILETICFVIYNRFRAGVFPKRGNNPDDLDALRKQAREVNNSLQESPIAEAEAEPTAAAPALKTEETAVEAELKTELSPAESEPKETTPEGPEKTKSYSFFQACILSFVAGLVFLMVADRLYGEMSSWINYVKLVVLTLLLAICAATDFKKSIIPNEIILAGLGLRVVLYVLEIVLFPQEVLAILKNDLIGVALGFGTLFIAFLISRQSIGFGDVKLFGMIGIISGAICTFSTLLFSLILNSLAAIVLLVARKKTRKSGLPFAPAVFLGYLIAVFISRF